MQSAVTVGEVLTVVGIIAGCGVLCVVGYVVLSIMASGWDH